MLHWFSHLIRMDHQHTPQQALYWEVSDFKRGLGRPNTNWRGLVKKDLCRMRIIWEEGAFNRQ